MLHRLCGPPSIPLSFSLATVLPRRDAYRVSFGTAGLGTGHTKHPSFRARTTRVSNPVCSPSFRASASVMVQCAAFATGVPPDIYAFHRYTGNSTHLSHTRTAVSPADSELSPEISQVTYRTAYAPFTPNNSEQRLPPSYYRGCWHEVSRGYFHRYRHNRPGRKEFTSQGTSSSTRRCCVRVSPIAQNSPLLPPVGVWTVFQFQCGRAPSQAGYRSKPWWAITPPTS